MQQSGVEGRYMNYEDPHFLLWVPSILVQTEITKEQHDAGILDVYASQDNPDYNITIRYDYQDESLETVEDMLGAIEGQYDDYAYATINGFNALTLIMNGGATMTAVISAGHGYFLQIIYNHVDDPEFNTVAGISLASIQDYPE